MSNRFLPLLFLAFSTALVTAQQNGSDRARPVVVSRFGIVATKNVLASQTGAMILERGGNAVDAAVAANAMLALVDPSIAGPGGDLFAIIYDAKTKKLYALNSSGWTPAGMTIEFLKQKGLSSIPPRSIYTVTVPGAAAGWDALESRLGRLGLARSLAPAIDSAENGVEVSEAIANNLSGAQRPTFKDPNLKATYLPSGHTPRVGELFRNPGLAASLRRIAQKGRDGFYQGPTAEAIVRLSKELGGAMTLADLKDFRPEWVEPISTTYRGWTVSELPPNSYGFAALAMLNIMEQLPLREYGHNSAKALHVMIEAKKLAYANIMEDLGDPRFTKVPIAALISKKLAETRAKSIDPEHAHCRVLPAELTAAADRIGQDTIYLSTVDAEGNLVSLIESNASGWGSGLVPPGCGFVLHDRGDGFSMDPHVPNSLAGRKRPVHTNMPGFMSNGEVRIAFGIMLGWNQAQAQAQFVSNIVDFGMNVQDAIAAARFSKRTFPGCDVMLESRVPDAVRSELTRLGHELQIEPPFTRNMGIGQAVMRDEKGINYGGSDPRVDAGAAVAQSAPR